MGGFGTVTRTGPHQLRNTTACDAPLPEHPQVCLHRPYSLQSAISKRDWLRDGRVRTRNPQHDSVPVPILKCVLFKNPAEMPLKLLDRMIRLDCCDTSAAELLDQASIEHGQACLQASGSTGETQERWSALSTLSLVGDHVYRERPPNGNASQCVSTPSTTTGVFMTKTNLRCQRTRHRIATQIPRPGER